MHSSLRIHKSRASQLRTVAAAAGISVAALLERLISAHVDAGEHDRLDGLTVSRAGDQIAFSIAGDALPIVSVATGRLICGALKHQLGGTGGPACRVAVTPTHNFEVRRTGSGFRVAFIHGETATPIASMSATRVMLGDLVRQVERVTL